MGHSLGRPGDYRVTLCPGSWASHPAGDACGSPGAVAWGRACGRGRPAKGCPHRNDAWLCTADGTPRTLSSRSGTSGIRAARSLRNFDVDQVRHVSRPPKAGERTTCASHEPTWRKCARPPHEAHVSNSKDGARGKQQPTRLLRRGARVDLTRAPRAYGSCQGWMVDASLGWLTWLKRG